ncbi:SDR family oxidoreductase [Streptomyces canus]|uniref:SDR family oxidoreductase n=1 Tax=Streptomyces canus TaxID=58343 RepID=UPI002E2E7D33|nr:SDR family oxidoreductase [Streptomyces canus]
MRHHLQRTAVRDPMTGELVLVIDEYGIRRPYPAHLEIHTARAGEAGSAGSAAHPGGVRGWWPASQGAMSATSWRSARAWAAELGSRGVRVNAISPGLANTPMRGGAFDDRAREMLEAVAAGLPSKRNAGPDEIAAAVTFLASSDSSFVYGDPAPTDPGQGPTDPPTAP